MVGVDASARSHRALSWAVAEAELWGAALDVVHGWLVPLALYEGRGPTQVDPVLLEQGSRAILDKAIASVATTGIDLTAMLVEGEAAPVLTQVAVGADLLVVGSRGPRRLGRPLARLGQSALHRIGTLPCRGGAPRCEAADAHDRGRGRRIGAFVRGAPLGRRRSDTAPDATGSRERLSRNPSRAAVRTDNIV